MDPSKAIKQELIEEATDDRPSDRVDPQDLLELDESQIKSEPSDESAGGQNQVGSSQASNRALKKGRKNRRIGAKVDMRAKLERSRQSARECRARKKLRYQYLEDLVVKREMANIALKTELQAMYKQAKSHDRN